MDIQKEREAFEQHLTDTGLVEFAGYGFAVDECDEYLHEPTQVAWDSWLIGLNRTKAQAVPEGFVLVSKTPSLKVLGRLFAEHDLDEDRATYIYKDIIDAQEPAND
ncbi:hypothetical protein [Acinetobacter sp. YH12085]|uniref:hypothetical protein n=1 Tax=Acinetobacter sp. YH12085 TaxID=2601077 RepID=UPI0015D3EB6B|nr:hypothetical protein [Acinetobacter sp. YH12085]